jgi:hypothetical protein
MHWYSYIQARTNYATSFFVIDKLFSDLGVDSSTVSLEGHYISKVSCQDIDIELSQGVAKTSGRHVDFIGEVPGFTEPSQPLEKFKEPVPPQEQSNPDNWEVPEPYLIYLAATGKAKRTRQEYRWDLLWWSSINWCC